MCCVQACTFFVRVTRVSPSQKPIVSPYTAEFPARAGAAIEVNRAPSCRRRCRAAPRRPASRRCAAVWPRSPLPHESLGPAIRSGPSVSGVNALVVKPPHHALLILWVRIDRNVALAWHARSSRLAVPPANTPVDAVPLRHRWRVRVFCRSASGLHIGQQRSVVLFRGFESVRAHDVFARPILAAVSPASRDRRVLTDARIARGHAGAAAAHVGDLPRTIAAPVTGIGPVLAVLVEILAREEIDRQGLHAGRRLRVPIPALGRN